MLILRSCPVCQTSSEKADTFLEENIDPNKISSHSFASRKEPEFMSHKLVRCTNCDLVYVSSTPAQSELAQAYHVAEYDSSEEANDAASTYINGMRPILNNLKRKERVLEIGSGTGVLLELLQKEGFSEFVGVEPSSAAILAAPVHRRSWLKEGIFEEKDFEPASFDLICCFMTMEHVLDPKITAAAAYRLLRPGGVFVTVTHDYRSFVNRILGKRSPIVDIEHMQLFSKKSILELFKSCEFDKISAEALTNTYSLKYWTRLLPIPKFIKNALKRLLTITGLEKIKVGINVGNMITAGFRTKV